MKNRCLCMFTLLLSTIAISLVISPSFAQEVSNREPKAREVGYFPADGKTIAINPPGFVWLPESDAKSYIVEFSQKSDFSSVEYKQYNIDLNVLCPNVLFNPGKWYWRYAFVTDGGKQSTYSKTRSFIVPDDAIEFPLVSIDEIVYRMPRKHPKLFVRPETVDEFRDDIQKNHKELWSNFISNADRMLEDTITIDEPAPYPDGHRGTGKANIDLWRKNRRYTVNAVDHASNLAFAYMLTNEEKYGQKAKEWLMAVISWPPDGTTSYSYNDECGMPILSRIPRAYTWVYPLLSDEEKTQIIASMKVRGEEIYNILRYRRHHTVSPYESHRNRAWHFMSETAIAFIDDIPEAREWLKYALTIFFSVYPVWNDDEGGWHEGVAYWKSYINRIAWWLDIANTAFGIDGYKKPFFNQTGYFPLYVMPPRSEFGGFSDGSDRVRPNNLGSLMHTLADRAENPYWKWYANEVWPYQVPSKPTYLDLLRIPKDSEGKPPVDLDSMKVFHGVGIASMHNQMGRPDKDINLLFKSSPFGTQSHGFNAQNSFILNVYGKPVLLWSGSRDWHGSEHHKKWMYETFSDNCITVNGKGQIKHSPKAKGKIISEYHHPSIDYVAGEASEAYDGQLNTFVRNIINLKHEFFIMIDELEAPEPSTFEYHLHANEKFNIKDKQFDIFATNESSSVRISFATPTDLIITQESGHNPPSVGFKGEQWHLTAKTPNKDKRAYFVAVYSPSQTNVMRSHYQIDRSTIRGKENIELYTIVSGKWVVLLTINPDRNLFQFGGIETDAAYLMMASFNKQNDTSILFAIDASIVKHLKKDLFKAEARDNYLVQWKDLMEKPQ
jgi:hypothetical protein